MKRITIKCDEEKREKSIQRMNAYYDHKEYLDRVPVYFGIEARYLLKERGVSFKEYFETPESNFYNQLMNFKWRIEHVEDDFLAAEAINIFPDFQNTTTAALFNEEAIIWNDNDTPRIDCFVNSIEEARKLTIPDMESGMALKKKEHILRMQELAKDYEVEINGTPIPVNIVMGWQETMFTGALSMMGENLLIWIYEYPEDIKRFFNMLTDACILYEKEMLKITKENRTITGSVTDGIEMISPQTFTEFVAPYYRKFYEAFPGTKRSMHNCGNITHLLRYIKDEMNIDILNGFGFVLNPQVLADTIGDSFFYSGGINPMTLSEGNFNVIREEVERYINILKPYRTYMLGDGYNVAPGTSADIMNEIVKLADEIGVQGES